MFHSFVGLKIISNQKQSHSVLSHDKNLFLYLLSQILFVEETPEQLLISPPEAFSFTVFETLAALDSIQKCEPQESPEF